MNSTPDLALTEITEIAVRLLVEELGIVNTARFINQFTLGSGDSLTEKDRLFGTMTVEQIATAIRKTSTPPSS